MEKTLTTENIVVLLVMISMVYAIMNFIQKYFQAYLVALSDLNKWGLNLKLNDNQQKYLTDLWIAYKNKQLPDDDMEQLLSETELEELLSYCFKDNLPDPLKKFYNKKKCEKFKTKTHKLGFNVQQTTILAGILFNKIGGIHAIRF